MSGITVTYVDGDTFTVSGDWTDEFVVNRRVKANCGVDGNQYSSVASSSYSNPDTTVDLNDSILTSNLVEVWYGVVPPPASDSAFPPESTISHGNLGGLSNAVDHPWALKEGDFTQDGGVLVGTGSGTFQEEAGAAVRQSILDFYYESGWYADLTTALAALDGIDTEIWLTSNDSLTSNFTEDLSGVDLRVKKGKTLTLNGISTIGFNIIIEDGGQILIDQDCTINNNIRSEGNTSGVVAFDAVTGDETLTINGSIDAGLCQIFGSSLTVAGDPKINNAYPEWFGAVGDGTTDDTAAFNATLSFFMFIQLRKTTYAIGSKISIPRGAKIVGQGVEGTYLKAITDGQTVLEADNGNDDLDDGTPHGYFIIRELTIDNNQKASIGIRIRCSKHFILETLYILNTKASGYGAKLGDVLALPNTQDNVASFVFDNVKFYDTAAVTAQLYIENGQTFRLKNRSSFAGSDVAEKGLYLRDCQNFTVIRCFLGRLIKAIYCDCSSESVGNKNFSSGLFQRNDFEVAPSSPSTTHMIHVEPGQDSYLAGWIFRDNVFDGTGTDSIYLDAGATGTKRIKWPVIENNKIAGTLRIGNDVLEAYLEHNIYVVSGSVVDNSADAHYPGRQKTLVSFYQNSVTGGMNTQKIYHVGDLQFITVYGYVRILSVTIYGDTVPTGETLTAWVYHNGSQISPTEVSISGGNSDGHTAVSRQEGTAVWFADGTRKLDVRFTTTNNGGWAGSESYMVTVEIEK